MTGQHTQKIRGRDECIAIAKSYGVLPTHVFELLVARLGYVVEGCCSNCHETGTIFSVVSSQLVSKTCICKTMLLKRRKFDEAFTASNIPKLYHGAKVDVWTNVGRDGAELALNQASHHVVCSYAARIRAMFENGYSLFLCGSHGAGKTYLACAIANVAIRNGYSARYFTLSEIVRHTVDGWFNEKAKVVTDALRDADFLVIDDLDKIYKTRTGIELSVFDVLLRSRLQAKLPCLITSNRPIAKAREDYGEAVYSMLVECCAEVSFIGDDHREQLQLKVRRAILNGD